MYIRILYFKTLSRCKSVNLPIVGRIEDLILLNSNINEPAQKVYDQSMYNAANQYPLFSHDTTRPQANVGFIWTPDYKP